MSWVTPEENKRIAKEENKSFVIFVAIIFFIAFLAIQFCEG